MKRISGMQSGQQQRTSFNVELVAEKFVCLWWHLTSVRQSMHSAVYGRLWPCHETERKCGKRFMSSCDIFTLHEVALNWFQSQKRTSDVVNCAGRWSFGWSITPSVRPSIVVLVSVAGGLVLIVQRNSTLVPQVSEYRSTTLGLDEHSVQQINKTDKNQHPKYDKLRSRLSA